MICTRAQSCKDCIDVQKYEDSVYYTGKSFVVGKIMYMCMCMQSKSIGLSGVLAAHSCGRALNMVGIIGLVNHLQQFVKHVRN